MIPLLDQVRTEQSWTSPPPDATAAAVLRWRLLHGEGIDGTELKQADGGPGPGLSTTVRQLERLGFTFSKTNLPREPGVYHGRARVRYQLTNPRHVPVDGGVVIPQSHYPGLRPGRVADVAAALVAAYPEATDLAEFGERKKVTNSVRSLRRIHGWEISLGEHNGRGFRLLHLPPDHEAPRSRAVVHRVAGATDALAHFHRPAPVVPTLGLVLRTTMIAEDNGHAAVVLTAMDGSRWFARVEGFAAAE